MRASPARANGRTSATLRARQDTSRKSDEEARRRDSRVYDEGLEGRRYARRRAMDGVEKDAEMELGARILSRIRECESAGQSGRRGGGGRGGKAR